MKSFVPCALLPVLVAAPAAWADDDALRRCRAIADAPARLACYDALPLRPASAAPSAAPAAATPAPPAAAPARFGLPEAPNVVPQIETRIDGDFEGWNPRDRIRLANGQVWQVIDDSTGVYRLQNPKVVVRRTAFGGFEMEIEGARRAPKVRRVE